MKTREVCKMCINRELKEGCNVKDRLDKILPQLIGVEIIRQLMRN